MTLTERPLRVFKMGQFVWIARCRRCSFTKAYHSHPLALKAALSHYSIWRWSKNHSATSTRTSHWVHTSHWIRTSPDTKEAALAATEHEKDNQ